MKKFLLRGVVVAVSCALAVQAQHSAEPPQPSAPRLLAAPRYAAAAQALDGDYDRFVSELIAITEVPAPPFKEDARAQAFTELARASGLAAVERDDEGNVLALRRGRGGPLLAIVAHLDTVFPEGTDVRVRRTGTRLAAPGVGDNSVGVATLLAIARALDAATIETNADILFVAGVGEEGPGSLRGVRHLLTRGRYQGRISAFIAIDGAGDGRFVTTGAVGSQRYHVTFEGPGGHSYGAFGIVNPATAMASAIRHLSAIPVPQSPKTTFNVGLLGGGTSVNTIPSSAWMDVDLRSEGAEALADLDRAFAVAMEQGARDENRERSIEAGRITVRTDLVGSRPSGQTADTTTLVRETAAAIRATGLDPSFGWSSTDANLPMSLGIPAITIDAGIRGDRAHAPDEWIDVERRATVAGLQRVLLIVLSVAGTE